MKALSLISTGKEEKAFEEREAPMLSPKSGEVLIKVETFGLIFADVRLVKGCMMRPHLYSVRARL